MTDKSQQELLNVKAKKWQTQRTEIFFCEFATLFEVVRRSAFEVDEKLQKVMNLLDNL